MNKTDLEMALECAGKILSKYKFRNVTQGRIQVLWYFDPRSSLWRDDGIGFLMALFKEFKLPQDPGFFAKVDFIIRCNNSISYQKFKPPIHFIAINNKQMLNLKTLEIEEINPDYYFTKKLNVEYSPHPPKEYLAALEKALPDPQKMFLLLQGFAQLLLIRTQDVDDIFILQGTGQNGKTTILHAITHLFAPYVSAVSMHQLQNNRFTMGQVEDKLANIYSEISGIRIKDIHVLKLLSSGDLVNVDNKFEKMHQASIKIIQFYSCNKMPEIEDQSFAVARRFVPIEFQEKIKIQDKKIKDKLTDEIEQNRIFSMLLRIARYTRKYDYVYRPNEKEVLEILEEKGNPIIQFLKEQTGYIKMALNEKTEKGLVYQAYTKFCERNGFIVQEKNSLTKVMAKKGFTETRSGNLKYWQGLIINKDVLELKQKKMTDKT